jgi:HD-GYP domain-containing protein (c-di-GMP phosphodiesterase class II)
MKSDGSELIDIAKLRIGLFVELDVGWLSHPFPVGNFKISSIKQIETIRSLGLAQVRWVPEKSDPEPQDVPAASDDVSVAAHALQAERQLLAQRVQQTQQRAKQLAAQQHSLVVCERRFAEASRQYKKTLEQIHTQPKLVAQQCQTMVGGFVGEMLTEGESAIRLLTEASGDKASMHPVNVTIVSLLLGKAMGLPEEDLADLGTAAFLHDIGKVMLPDRVRWLEENFSTAEYKLYQEHVAQSLQLVKGMDLPKASLLCIAQHHELADGSGYPARVRNDAMTPASRVLSLVNRYDSLCNPSRPTAAMTPHEALSIIFAQQKNRFDPVALSAFIRMVGVYPPGSVVQLMDERYAMVVSVNSARPLKPRIIVHDPGVARHEALILDLEKEPNVGIRRSLKPVALPSAAMEFLSPRQRISYFFEAVQDNTQADLALA